jgi:hypothetical protein
MQQLMPRLTWPLRALRAAKRFRLFVVAHDKNAPPDRWFRSRKGAMRAFNALDERWKSSAWLIEYRDQPTIGGISLVRNVIHIERGQLVVEKDCRAEE